MIEDGDFKMLFVTADERVDMLKSIIFETVFPHDPLFDFITFSPSTGNKNYIEWVKKQTLTLDGNDPEFPEEDDESHPDSMNGVPEVDADELANATSNGTAGTTTPDSDDEFDEEDDDDEDEKSGDDTTAPEQKQKKQKRKRNKRKRNKKKQRASFMTMKTTDN